MNLKPARLLIALIAAVAAPAFAQNLAVVNGKAIPSSRVDAVVKQVVAQGQQPDSPQLREAIKKEMIGREVLMQEAEKQGYAKNADVKAQLENARQAIFINALVGEYVKKNPVKDADIKAEYDKFVAQTGNKEYHVRHILVETEAEANAVIAKLKGGASSKNWPRPRKTPAPQPTAATWTGQPRRPSLKCSRTPSWPCKKARSPRKPCRPRTVST